jgi:GTP-binding protein
MAGENIRSGACNYRPELSRPRKAAFIKSSSRTEECPPPNRPEFAFIGRSNVGKSSLINRLVGQKDLAKVSQRPGKTQLINHFTISDGHWYLVDLPGYGYAKVSKVLRETFSRMIGHYLRNRENLVCIFVLVDARHAPQKLDLDFMAQLAEWQLPFSLVFTKADKLSKAAQLKTVENYQRKLLEFWEECPPCFLTSAETGKGRDALLDYLESLIPIFDAPRSRVQNP